MAKKNFRRGGVSMFLVIVAGSLVALVVASFLRMVIRDQQVSSDNDLSQSAYDSAQAGVEDAKRALLIYQQTCSNSTKVTECDKMRTELSKSLNEQSCRLLAETFEIGDPRAQETVIRTNDGDNSLNQAYTCVKVAPKTSSFEGELSAGGSKLIPLKTDNSFKFIKISWHTKYDNSNNSAVRLPTSNGNMLELFSNASDWNKEGYPSILRSQIITSNSFNFDNIVEFDKAISKTAFLFPSSSGMRDSSLNGTIVRAQSSATRHNFSQDSLSGIRCENNLDSATYACSAVIELENEITPDSGAIMKISTQYGLTANYLIELFDFNRNFVNFDGVQPLVDSTGRASDKFRRVQARVEMSQITLPIPDFAVSTDGKFCKAMVIRDKTKASDIECK